MLINTRNSIGKLSILTIALILTGCADKIDQIKDEEEIIKTAHEQMQKKNYDKVLKLADKLSTNFAYSEYLPEMQLMEAKCHLEHDDIPEALNSLTIFVKSNPTHEQVPYAIFEMAKCCLNQYNTPERCQQGTSAAMEYLNELIDQYPNSEYIEEAKKMMNICNNRIAAYELNIARFYQKEQNFAAAISHLNIIIDNFKETDCIHEAFFRLAECFVSIGAKQDAKNALIVIKTMEKGEEWKKYVDDFAKKHDIDLDNVAELHKPESVFTNKKNG